MCSRGYRPFCSSVCPCPLACIPQFVSSPPSSYSLPLPTAHLCSSVLTSSQPSSGPSGFQSGSFHLSWGQQGEYCQHRVMTDSLSALSFGVWHHSSSQSAGGASAAQILLSPCSPGYSVHTAESVQTEIFQRFIT